VSSLRRAQAATRNVARPRARGLAIVVPAIVVPAIVVPAILVALLVAPVAAGTRVQGAPGPDAAPGAGAAGDWLSVSLELGHARSVSVELSLSADGAGARTFDRDLALLGGVDLYPEVELAWRLGRGHATTYVTGDIPMSDDHTSVGARAGPGPPSLDAGGGLAYRAGGNGFAAAVLAGVAYTLGGDAAEPESGVDAHLDGDVSRPVSARWRAGLAGYVHAHVGHVDAESAAAATAATAATAADLAGASPARVAALGPELRCTFSALGVTWLASLHGYAELRAERRLPGLVAFATLGIPLGGGPDDDD